MPSLKEMKEQGDVPPPPIKLDEDGKKEWAHSGQVFDLLSCDLKEADGGRAYWEVLCTSLEVDYSFGLSSHPKRNGAMEVYHKASQTETVTGCRLVVLEKMRGTEFYVIDAAE